MFPFITVTLANNKNVKIRLRAEDVRSYYTIPKDTTEFYGPIADAGWTRLFVRDPGGDALDLTVKESPEQIDEMLGAPIVIKSGELSQDTIDEMRASQPVAVVTRTGKLDL